MTRRVLRTTLLVLALPAAVVLGKGDGKAKSDQELIQGTWECIATLKDGKQVETYVGVRAVIQDKNLTWIFPQPDGKTKTVKATFQLDSGKNPKYFDWSPADNPSEVHKRLYVLQGDTLLWSTNLGKESRPESFTAGEWLFVMKRVKDKE